MKTSKLLLIAVFVCATIAPAAAYTGNCGYYTNSYGHVVPRPCGNARTDKPPPGSTAICRDGSYSFSEHHSSTCSGHGGVARWR